MLSAKSNKRSWSNQSLAKKAIEKQMLGELVAKTIVDLVRSKSLDELVLECAEQTAENFKHMLALDERDFALSGLTDELKVRIAKEYLTEQTKQTQKCRNGFFKDIPLITRIIEWRTIRDVNKAFERFVCLVSNL